MPAALLIFDAAMSLMEAMLPHIQAAVKSGQVTPAEQQDRLHKLDALRDAAAFQGPEWEPSKP